MTTYSELLVSMDEIAARTVRNREHVVAAKTRLVRAQTDLAAMQSEYSAISTEINTLATNNPSDEALQDLKRVKDKLADDFVDLKGYVDDLITAYDGVVE